MSDQPNPNSPTPENPTLGRNAGFYLDAQGNVTGIFFTVQVDHFVEYTDEAINLTPGAGEPEKPNA